MKELFKIIRSVISDYGKHISGSKIREFEAEDPLSEKLLQQKLCSENCKRIFFFAVPLAIASMIAAVLTIININKYVLAEAILSFIGLVVMIFGCSFVALMLFNEYKRKKSKEAKLKKLTLAFWAVFSLGLLLLCIADFSLNSFSYRFCLYIVVLIVIPLFDLKKSLLFILPFFAATIVLGIIFHANIELLLLAAVFSFAYVTVSSLVYSSYCCLYISDRQLNIANERCRQINEKDSLTGLLNKKGLIRRLMDIIDRGADKNIAAIFFDIDDFRRYNHIYTDTQSDECLYNICNCVRIIAKPKTDIISRYSGDEFVIIVQNISEYDLVSFAEQIRKSVEIMGLPFENEKTVTISVGISSIIEDDFTDYSKMFTEAEDNLAIAKKGGKNCVGYMGNVFKAR